MEKETFAHACPNCGDEVKLASPRYLGCLCKDCEDKLTDESGKTLRAFNLTMSGGFIALHEDDTVCDVASDRHLAYIGPSRYYWNEARFGGTVALPWTQDHEAQYGQAPLGGVSAYWAKQEAERARQAEQNGDAALVPLIFLAFVHLLKKQGLVESTNLNDWTARVVRGTSHARGVIFRSKNSGRSWVYYDYFLHFDAAEKRWIRRDATPDPAYGSPVLVSEVTDNPNRSVGLIYSHYMNWAH